MIKLTEGKGSVWDYLDKECTPGEYGAGPDLLFYNHTKDRIHRFCAADMNHHVGDSPVI